MKKIVIVALLTGGAFLFNSCFTAKPVVTKQTFTYDYKTDHTEKLGSAGILVTLVRPRYANDFVRQYGEADVFVNWRKFIGDDIEELLIDKGYRIKSTYPSFDNMTYDEKKNVDVALEIEIAPTFTAYQGQWTTYTPLKFSTTGTVTHYYGYNGTVSLIGKINLIALEPVSHEKIWIKSIDIPSITNIHISTSHKLYQPVIDVDFLNDPNVYNTLGAALQQQYKGILGQIDMYLDPREFIDLKPQIQELKKATKVY